MSERVPDPSCRSGLGLCVLLSSLGCQNNTIELEFPPAGTGGSTAGTGDGSSAEEASTSGPSMTSTVTTSPPPPPPPPPTTVSETASTTTTGDPPPSVGCQGYAALVMECYGSYGEEAYGYCLEYVAYMEMLGGDCPALFEDYLVCISALTCQQLMMGTTEECEAIFMQLQLQCP